MSLIGVRELRQQASEVIRRVCEENAEYVITYPGHPRSSATGAIISRIVAEVKAATAAAVLSEIDAGR